MSPGRCQRRSHRVVAPGLASVPVATAGLLCLMVLLLACNPDRAEAVDYYNQGMEAGSSEATADLMEQALEVDPTFSTAAYSLGQVYQFRLSDPESAEEQFRLARRHESDNPRYAYRLATALADQGEHQEAVEYFREAIELHPQYARAWFEKAMSQDAAGESAKAAQTYITAIEVNPRLRMDEHDAGGEHYHALADLYLRYRLFDHAVRVYEDGVRNNPASARLAHGLGISLMELERFEQAVEAFDKALDIDEDHAWANYNIAIAMDGAGQTEEAIEQLESILERPGREMTETHIHAAQRLLDDLQSG